MHPDLEGSAAGGCFCQRHRLDPSGICASSSTSHLPPSLSPFTTLPLFSTAPDTCIASPSLGLIPCGESSECPTGQLGTLGVWACQLQATDIVCCVFVLCIVC